MHFPLTWKKLATLILAELNHRGSPQPPLVPWVMHQSWQHTLFCTWEVPAETLGARSSRHGWSWIHSGKTYVSQLPASHGEPALARAPHRPRTSNFPEMNCRTYVRVNGEPGICFFTIDADSLIVTWLQRRVPAALRHVEDDLGGEQ